MTEQMAVFSISGLIWQPDGFRPGCLYIEAGKIVAVRWGENLPADMQYPDCYICPGLVDLQINGALGHDFTRDPESVAPLSEALPRWGVTAFLPTYITAPLELYHSALQWLRQNAATTPGARVLGAHLEGPYLNPGYKGAHDEQYIRLPSLDEMQQIREVGGDWLKFVTLAPEREGATQVARFLADSGVLVAAGHSGATYEEGLVAFEQGGVRCITHLFNANPPLHHRKPGLIGATLNSPEITANIIADGVHLHPAMVKLVFLLKGADKTVLVTDAMAGMGMPPGRYDLAGQDVIVDETSARLNDANGTLAGSILTLNTAVKNMAEFSGCTLAQAVQMASLNPARLLGLDDRMGKLDPGYFADIAVLTQNFEPRLTLVNGEVRYSSV